MTPRRGASLRAFAVCFLAFASIPAPLFAQVDGARSPGSTASKTPRIQLVWTPEEGQAFAQAWARLQFDDAWIERRALLVKSPGDASATPLQASTPTQKGGGPPSWVLRDAEGRTLGAGSGLPTPETVRGLLDADQGPSPLTTLEAFLRTHPDRWDARRALLQNRRGTLVTKLALAKRRQALPQDEDLLDDLVWGPMAEALDAALDGVDWIAGSFHLDPFLPEDVPERTSPRMLTLYRRRRPEVLAALQEWPDCPAAWSALVRMNLALGDMLWPSLDPIPFRLSPPSAWTPLLWGAKRISDLCLAHQQPEEAIGILRLIWTNHAPVLEARARLQGLLPKGDATASKAEDAERERAWSLLLGPLSECLIRANRMAELRGLLGSLGDAAGGIATPARVDALLKKTGRMDLREELVALLPPPTPRAPPSQNVFPGGGLFCFVVQEQPLFDPEHGLDWALVFALDPAIVPWGGPLSESQRSSLKWPAKGPRWALLSPQGAVLAEGGTLPAAPDLVRTLQDAGVVFRETALLRHRKDHPDDLPTHALLAALAESQQRLLDFSATRPSARTKPIHPMAGFPEPLGLLRASWSRILETPLGRTREVLIQAGLGWTKGRPGGELDHLLDDLASAHLQSVEGDLRRRPGDAATWRLWLSLAPRDPHAPAAMFEQLDPLPTGSHGMLWPAPEIHEDIAQFLARMEQWNEVVDWLLPRWRARLRPPPQGMSSPSWTPRLSALLASGLSKLGRTQEANEVQALGPMPPPTPQYATPQ